MEKTIHSVPAEEIEKIKADNQKRVDAIKKAKRKENITFIISLIITIALIVAIMVL